MNNWRAVSGTAFAQDASHQFTPLSARGTAAGWGDTRCCVWIACRALLACSTAQLCDSGLAVQNSLALSHTVHHVSPWLCTAGSDVSADTPFAPARRALARQDGTIEGRTLGSMSAMEQLEATALSLIQMKAAQLDAWEQQELFAVSRQISRQVTGAPVPQSARSCAGQWPTWHAAARSQQPAACLHPMPLCCPVSCSTQPAPCAQ